MRAERTRRNSRLVDRSASRNNDRAEKKRGNTGFVPRHSLSLSLSLSVFTWVSPVAIYRPVEFQIGGTLAGFRLKTFRNETWLKTRLLCGWNRMLTPRSGSNEYSETGVHSRSNGMTSNGDRSRFKVTFSVERSALCFPIPVTDEWNFVRIGKNWTLTFNTIFNKISIEIYLVSRPNCEGSKKKKKKEERNVVQSLPESALLQS